MFQTFKHKGVYWRLGSGGGVKRKNKCGIYYSLHSKAAIKAKAKIQKIIMKQQKRTVDEHATYLLHFVIKPYVKSKNINYVSYVDQSALVNKLQQECLYIIKRIVLISDQENVNTLLFDKILEYVQSINDNRIQSKDETKYFSCIGYYIDYLENRCLPSVKMVCNRRGTRTSSLYRVHLEQIEMNENPPFQLNITTGDDVLLNDKCLTSIIQAVSDFASGCVDTLQEAMEKRTSKQKSNKQIQNRKRYINKGQLKNDFL
jgi:hypothetical protein